MKATALIAEDEALLAEALRAELAALWPELDVVGTAAHGAAAVELALQHRPQVCFLDIRMPGMTGLEAAAAITDDWPLDAGGPPLFVFVTAYDQYAVQAFERAAVDYVLKPVQTERLRDTCERLQAALAKRAPAADALAASVDTLRALLGAAAPAEASQRLRVVQVAHGSSVLMLPVEEIDFFEAADKYVRLTHQGREHLIRMSLRELLPRLDPDRFWQIHRGCIVRVDAVERAERDEAGHVTLHLRGRPERLAVSRMYAGLFKGL